MGFERALVAFAHPDDAEFGCAGTVARWTRDGTVVTYVCVTDGSAGSNEPGAIRDDVARQREDELRKAAEILGVSEVVFLGYPDGELEPSLDVRRDLTREVRRARPDVVVGPDPSRLWSGDRYVNHPDHVAVGHAVLRVVNPDAPTRPQFPELLDEGLEPFEVPRLWLNVWDAGREELHVVDISGTIDAKMDALRAHESQISGEDVERFLRDQAREIGRPRGYEYGEAFRTFDLTRDRSE